MGLVLGFGSTEKEEREKIKGAVIGALAEGDLIGPVLAQWNNRADEYDEMPRGEAPQRYTRVWYHSPRDGESAKLVYHHVNREHALSPDGWAMWRVEEQLAEDQP